MRNPWVGDRIDYMNARRDSKPYPGGSNHAVTVNQPAERERLSTLTQIEQITEEFQAKIANQRAIVREFRNRLAAGLTVDEIPF